MGRISQREARRLRKRVAALEDILSQQRRVWGQEWFGGVEIAQTTWAPTDAIPVAVKTARKLGHAVVVKGDDSGRVQFMALPLKEEAI